MTKKWIKYNWVNFTPLLIFFAFMSIYSLAETVLQACPAEKDSWLCSNISVANNLVLSKEEQPSIQNPSEKRKINTVAYSRQFVWVFLIGINIFFNLTALAVYILLARKSVKSKYILICLFISLLCGTLSASAGSPVIEPVINSTLEPNENTYCQFGGINVVKIVRFVNFVTTTLAVATAFALCSILFRRPRKGVKKQQRLLNQVDDLRIVLYIATLLLIVSILRMSAVLTWSLSFLPENMADDVNKFFSTFTFVIGSSYTILLASIYLPVYYILKNRAIALVQKNSPNEDTLLEKFKSEFFTFSIRDSLPRILAIAAPFLTGTVSEELIRKIFSGG